MCKEYKFNGIDPATGLIKISSGEKKGEHKEETISYLNLQYLMQRNAENICTKCRESLEAALNESYKHNGSIFENVCPSY